MAAVADQLMRQAGFIDTNRQPGRLRRYLKSRIGNQSVVFALPGRGYNINPVGN